MRSAPVSDAGGGGSLHSLHTSVRLGEDAACHRVQSMSAVTEAVPSAASSPAGCAVSPRAPAGGRDTGSPSTLPPHSAASPRGTSASVSSCVLQVPWRARRCAGAENRESVPLLRRRTALCVTSSAEALRLRGACFWMQFAYRTVRATSLVLSRYYRVG